jgi:hypothetical protein
MNNGMQHTRTQFHVSNRDIDDERLKETGTSRDLALSAIITRRALQEHIHPYGCVQLSSDERGRTFEVTGRRIPRKMKPRKFSRSVLIKRRMNELIETARSKE